MVTYPPIHVFMIGLCESAPSYSEMQLPYNWGRADEVPRRFWKLEQVLNLSEKAAAESAQQLSQESPDVPINSFPHLLKAENNTRPSGGFWYCKHEMLLVPSEVYMTFNHPKPQRALIFLSLPTSASSPYMSIPWESSSLFFGTQSQTGGGCVVQHCRATKGPFKSQQLVNFCGCIFVLSTGIKIPFPFQYGLHDIFHKHGLPSFYDTIPELKTRPDKRTEGLEQDCGSTVEVKLCMQEVPDSITWFTSSRFSSRRLAELLLVRVDKTDWRWANNLTWYKAISYLHSYDTWLPIKMESDTCGEKQP